MAYAQVTDNTIDTISGRLPKAARRLDTGQWISPPDAVWTQAEHEACGWFTVVDTPRPADTATTTHDRSVELVDGTPTVVWTVRDKTADELAAEAAAVNESNITQRALDAITGLQAIIDTDANNLAQVNVALDRLAKVCTALVRLQLRALDTDAGTG